MVAAHCTGVRLPDSLELDAVRFEVLLPSLRAELDVVVAPPLEVGHGDQVPVIIWVLPLVDRYRILAETSFAADLVLSLGVLLVRAVELCVDGKESILQESEPPLVPRLLGLLPADVVLAPARHLVRVWNRVLTPAGRLVALVVDELVGHALVPEVVHYECPWIEFRTDLPVVASHSFDESELDGLIR